VLHSDREKSFGFSTRNLSPEQFSWLTVEQIPLISTNFIRISGVRRGLFKYLNEEQLKAFTEDQIEKFPVSVFSMEQMRFLVEYGTATFRMKSIIHWVDSGLDLFENYERRFSEIPPSYLARYFRYLKPEQFQSIRTKRFLNSLLMTGYFTNLSPAQIYYTRHFVKSLQWDTILEYGRKLVTQTGYRRAEDVVREYIEDKYGTLNITSLLDEDQIRGIHPSQIPDLNENQLDTLRKKRNRRGLFVFTPEQFNALTPEQLNYIIKRDYYYSERFISEEQLEVLSIAHIDVLLKVALDREIRGWLIERREYLLEYGDIELTAGETPPDHISKRDIYRDFLENHLFKSYHVERRRVARLYSDRRGGVCATRYKEEKAGIVNPNIVLSVAMDDLDGCIFNILKYSGYPWDQGVLLEGCTDSVFGSLPDKFQEACYQRSCLNAVVEQKVIAFKNYDKCLKEYHPELRTDFRNKN